MNESRKTGSLHLRNSIALTVIWTVLVGSSLSWYLYEEHRHTIQEAQAKARANLDENLAFFRWATGHGGVYVLATEETPPNPYLSHVPERDIVTPSGRLLTLVNPPYMMRLVLEFGREQYGTRGHLTSLNPLNPWNVPDSWEAEALRAFERGKTEVSSVETEDGKSYLRLMLPLVTEHGCLECHAAQGYKEGDIRGGISVSVPLAPIPAIERPSYYSAAVLGHIVLWVFGLAGIAVGGRRIGKHIRERDLSEERVQRGFNLETALRRIDRKVLEGANFREALEIACGAVVEIGYRMCWVGLAEPDYTIRPVGVRGFDGGVLTELQLRWDESPQGNVPAGIAIRTERTYVCPDVLASSLYGPWREKAEKVGYRSSATIPLKIAEEGIIGCLTVFREQVGDFSPEEIRDLETFAYQCTIVIINARRLEELRDTSQRLAFHFNRMPLGYIVHDREFRITGWNPAAERIFGWSADEAMGKHPFELIVPTEMQAHVSGIWSKLCKGDESSGGSAGPAIRKDGGEGFCEFFSTALRDARGAMTGLLTLVHDLTEKTKLERQLQTAQRMESVGTLAGGIAHDFNNALTGIIGYGELLRGKVAGDQGALQDLDVMMNAAERASTLTRQLLAYARRLVIEPVNMSLNTLTADLMKLMSKVVGEHVEVSTFLAKDLPIIRADRGQIEQVVMNLCLNARDAMPTGGQLLVETEAVCLDEEYVKHNPYIKAGRYALLKVSDTGIGMDEKTRARVFEPFFTTKGPDRGTGLGLAMVYGIVKQHEGYIHLYSELGKGTTFKVYFPAVEALPNAVPETRREETVRGGTETILLAEDEESVRRLAEQALEELGYNVLIARNGEEAIEIFRQNEDIALAVLDVIMPKKGGKEAYEQMHKVNPNLKVIFMSGYTANAIHESFILIADVPFLPKPFGPSALARKVREVLDSA